MPGPVSPLQTIKHKELEVRQRVEQARREAAARVEAAKAEAAQLIAQADQAGRAEAAEAYRQGIERAHQEAKAIATAAGEEAAALRSRALARLDNVAEQIVELVHAPRNGENTDYRDEGLSG